MIVLNINSLLNHLCQVKAISSNVILVSHDQVNRSLRKSYWSRCDVIVVLKYILTKLN